MRTFTVVDENREVTVYEGFDRCSGDSDFKLILPGCTEEVEGAFFCKIKDLAVAVSEVIRYDQEQFGRTTRTVEVTWIF